MQEVDKKELIKVGIVLHSMGSNNQIKDQFPTLFKFLESEDIEPLKMEVLEDGIRELKESDHVTILQEDFLNMYAFVQAVLGSQETLIRFPNLRSIALNISDDERLKKLLDLVRSIEQSIVDKFTHE